MFGPVLGHIGSCLANVGNPLALRAIVACAIRPSYRHFALPEVTVAVFLTKVWGFGPETYPALGFHRDGARLKFLRESKPGDWVVMAGTKGDDTARHQRGRLLGMVQLGADAIDVEAVLESVGTPIPQEHYLDGSYRWPHGLPMLAARRFTPQPDLKSTLGSYLPGLQWAAFALNLREALGSAAVAAIESLPYAEVDIIESPIIARQRSRAATLARARRTGPGPSTHRRASDLAPGEGLTYLLQLVGTRRSVFKVGYTKRDLGVRVGELDGGLVGEISGLSWRPRLSQPFPSASDAYRFEQELHATLTRWLVPGETETYEIDRGQLETHWATVLNAAKWAE